jgi:hypothetical protein
MRGLGLMRVYERTHWRRVPEVNSSVMKLTHIVFWSSHESWKLMMFLCFSCFSTRISANSRSRSSLLFTSSTTRT